MLAMFFAKRMTAILVFLCFVMWGNAFFLLGMALGCCAALYKFRLWGAFFARGSGRFARALSAAAAPLLSFAVLLLSIFVNGFFLSARRSAC
jgi:hypothetical protein